MMKRNKSFSCPALLLVLFQMLLAFLHQVKKIKKMFLNKIKRFLIKQQCCCIDEKVEDSKCDFVTNDPYCNHCCKNPSCHIQCFFQVALFHREPLFVKVIVENTIGTNIKFYIIIIMSSIMNQKIEKSEKKHIYFVGIGGAGTSVLARLYRSQGNKVSGSDNGDEFYTTTLEKEGIKIYKNFDKKNVPKNVNFVVHSTAFDDSNVEVAEVKKLGMKTLSYPEALGELTKNFFTIAVCGTHGKTTTTALLTHSLIACEKNPTAIVGAPVTGWEKGGFREGGKDFLVFEADEYQNKLAFYHPNAVILTSLDYDHPDFFPDFEEYKKVFVDFVKKIPAQGILVACGNDRDVLEVAKEAKCRVITYGTKYNFDVHLIDRKMVNGKQKIEVSYDGKIYILTTNLFGLHNALNVVASWIMSFILTGNAELSGQGVAEFLGTKRRLEKKGEFNKALLFDDYAHHPEEIRATLSTLRENFPGKKLIVAFHPHTFSRTKALLDNFARMLDMADQVIVLDIYGSARETQGGVSAKNLVDEINQGIQKKAFNLKDIKELVKFMQENLTEKDVFVTLGAGDIYKVYEILKKRD